MREGRRGDSSDGQELGWGMDKLGWVWGRWSPTHSIRRQVGSKGCLGMYKSVLGHPYPKAISHRVVGYPGGGEGWSPRSQSVPGLRQSHELGLKHRPAPAQVQPHWAGQPSTARMGQSGAECWKMVCTLLLPTMEAPGSSSGSSSRSRDEGRGGGWTPAPGKSQQHL